MFISSSKIIHPHSILLLRPPLASSFLELAALRALRCLSRRLFINNVHLHWQSPCCLRQKERPPGSDRAVTVRSLPMMGIHGPSRLSEFLVEERPRTTTTTRLTVPALALIWVQRTRVWLVGGRIASTFVPTNRGIASLRRTWRFYPMAHDWLVTRPKIKHQPIRPTLSLTSNG